MDKFSKGGMFSDEEVSLIGGKLYCESVLPKREYRIFEENGAYYLEGKLYGFQITAPTTKEEYERYKMFEELREQYDREIKFKHKIDIDLK